MIMKKKKEISSTFESFLQEKNILPTLIDLSKAYELLYQPCKLFISKLEKEAESHDYSAYIFTLNNHQIIFRTAKITPKKVGQFVTFWKRLKTEPIAPYDISDSFDFLIINVCMEQNSGQFIFPKKILQEKGVLSKNGLGGKRALRVYPPWDLVESTQAKKTQNWQLNYFVEIQPKQDFDTLKKLLF